MPAQHYTQKLLCENCSLICNNRQHNSPGSCFRYNTSDVLMLAHVGHTRLGPIFNEHWHEQLQLLYFTSGAASIHCNAVSHELRAGDTLLINSNEIHYGTNYSQETRYYILKINFKTLFDRQPKAEQMQYLAPLLENRLFFQNKISRDPKLNGLIGQIIAEHDEQAPGYELSVTAAVYNIIVYLLRCYQQKSMAATRPTNQMRSLDQLRPALVYLDRHYSENIELDNLARLGNMSPQHFCRLFKALTGRRPMDYMNFLRINKAIMLLAENHLNISEIALAVGFNDTNYFSRVFKKYQRLSPSKFRQKQNAPDSRAY